MVLLGSVRNQKIAWNDNAVGAVIQGAKMIKNIDRNGAEIELEGVELSEQDFPQIYNLLRKEQENEQEG